MQPNSTAVEFCRLRGRTDIFSRKIALIVRVSTCDHTFRQLELESNPRKVSLITKNTVEGQSAKIAHDDALVFKVGWRGIVMHTAGAAAWHVRSGACGAGKLCFLAATTYAC
jgi:hypothetical protein